MTNPSKLRTQIALLTTGLTPIQHGVAAFATWFLLFTFIQDAFTLALAPLFKLEDIGKFVVGFVFTFISTVLPSLAVASIHPELQKLRYKRNSGWPIAFIIICQALGYLGIIVIEILFILPLAYLEFWFPVTVLPFITVLCGVLCIALGSDATAHLQKGSRVKILALCLLLILSVRYIELNTRKPFTRDLSQIHRGMTGAEVETIMRRHFKNWVVPESEHFLHLEPNYTGETWFRHTKKWWGNTDWGKVVFENGRVKNVEICLCD